MNISRFVLASSLILLGWLGATFLNRVPSQSYPPLGVEAQAIESAEHEERPIGGIMATTEMNPPVPARN